jgi:hypothetical protein
MVEIVLDKPRFSVDRIKIASIKIPPTNQEGGIFKLNQNYKPINQKP